METDQTTGEPGGSRAGILGSLDHASQWVERPLHRREASTRINPLPHSGTISVFLLGVAVVSGLYLSLFFEFGHAASYEAVAKMERHPIQRTVRALHRYSSAALVVTTLVHALRIFIAGRFRGGNRPFRWATGLAALLLVWLTGVTGYWLIWDERAQALNEATLQVLRSAGVGRSLILNELSGVVFGSGSGFLLVLCFVHVALTALIGWFTVRHLRRSKLPWFPPQVWMTLMGGALVLVSILVPAGMLGPANPGLFPAEMPLDPFVLFLLPPLLSDARWVILILGAAALVVAFLLPRLLRGRSTPIIQIDADSCTGCDLCVVDCPFDALSLVAAPARPTPLAVLNADRCVGCGICLGSCSFDAITFPGEPESDPVEVEGRHVVIACQRHLQHSSGREGLSLGPETIVSGVRCAGSFEPAAVRELIERGALDVQLVGCPAGECVYGTGNRLAAQRLDGERSPHPARKFHGQVYQDWVSPLDLRVAIAEPGDHPFTEPEPPERHTFALAGVVVMLSVMAIVAGTQTPFRDTTDVSGLRIGLDHTHRTPFSLTPNAGVVGVIERIEATIGARSLGVQRPRQSDSASIDLLDWELPPGAGRLQIKVFSDAGALTVVDEEVNLAAGTRKIVHLRSVAGPPGAEDGRRVFTARSAGCTVCHSVEPNDHGVGPSLYGVATRAGGLVEGLSAELYLRQSILLPDQYIAEGWPAGQMLPIYLDRLSEEELRALITYLLTLEEDSQ